jgi:hypothetical protein
VAKGAPGVQSLPGARAAPAVSQSSSEAANASNRRARRWYSILTVAFAVAYASCVWWSVRVPDPAPPEGAFVQIQSPGPSEPTHTRGTNPAVDCSDLQSNIIAACGQKCGPEVECNCERATPFSSLDGRNVSYKKLTLTFPTITGDLDLRHVSIGTLEIRGGSIGAISLQNSTIGTLDISSVDVRGVIELIDSDVDEFELAYSKSHALELGLEEHSGNRIGALIVRNSAMPTVLLAKATVADLDFTSLISERIELTNSEVLKAQLNHVRADTLSLVGSLGNVDLGDSTIQRLKVGEQTAEQLQWSHGRLSSIEHDHGSSSLLAHVRGQAHNPAAFAALERSFQNAGRVSDARWVHVQGLADAFGAESDGWTPWLQAVRLSYLDGHGSPVAYLLLLAVLVFWGAVIFAAPRGHRPAFVKPARPRAPPKEPPPVYVARQESAQWHLEPKANDAEPEEPRPFDHDKAYNPLIMSLATLLPGDTLNYLRNYRFEPKSSGQAARVTLLQVFALLVQGLLVWSVIALLGR